MESRWHQAMLRDGLVDAWETNGIPGCSWPTITAQILSGAYAGINLTNGTFGPGLAVVFSVPDMGTPEFGPFAIPTGGPRNFPYGQDVEPD